MSIWFSAPPVFTKKPSDVHAHVSTDVRFECLADGIPKPKITWSRNGDIIGSFAYTIVGDGFLIVQDLVFSDAGGYQCFAENYLGKVQATGELVVYRRGKYCSCICTMDVKFADKLLFKYLIFLPQL